MKVGVHAPPEMWGGIECTVNRVGDCYFDQIQLSGHQNRRSDLSRFAELGLRTLRFPAIWEKTENTDGSFAWEWLDERLNDARDLNIRVIVGFLHHGSGPSHTSLLDPQLPNKFAVFARAFAERYPWVDAYTPVNEPLTTARFSGLYGLWYPHATDNLSFVRMLFNQCQAISAAMRAVRKVNPLAQLIQTEDLGRVFATPLLQYQAQFENERRWFSLDVLTGKFAPTSILWDFCREAGMPEAEIVHAAQASVCVPNIIGINHYVTSNRMLDERVERYPSQYHGGNGKHRYADVEAARVGAEVVAGPHDILQETWDRFQLPLAVTEAHIGCTREEQLRWLNDVWLAAKALCDEGVDVRAITVWSLLGSFDWDSLLTRPHGHYEPGVFDLRSDFPRPTRLCAQVSAFAAGKIFDHPALDEAGWWKRPDRLLYPPVALNGYTFTPEGPRSLSSPRKILISGASGSLGTAFSAIATKRGLAHIFANKEQLDIACPQSVEKVLASVRPWAVINAGGYQGIDAAEENPQLCFRENANGPAVLATACARLGIPFLTFSSDQVFDGGQEQPYVEASLVAPLNVYGRSKADAEISVQKLHRDALVVRSGAFFGPWDERNFVTRCLKNLTRGLPFSAASDLTVSPTYLPDLVNASLDLLIDGETGIWNLANLGHISWADLATEVALQHGFAHAGIQRVPQAALGFRARRPSSSALCSTRASLMPSLENALERYRHEVRVSFL